MRRNITIKTLLLLSLFVTGSAWAEWIKIDSMEVSILYIDPATIRKEGSLRKVWTLFNLKQRATDGTMSIRSRQEFDCKDEKYRFLTMTKYTGPMTEGKMISNGENPSDWFEIPPDTSAESFLKIVCAQ